MPDHPDVLIVGGGPAGSAAACHLARAGCRVVVLERDPVGRQRVCGEFLSFSAALELDRLGLVPAELGATAIEWIGLASGGISARSRLPFPAFGLPREVLDEHLLARAARAGAEIRRPALVRSIRHQGTWRVTLNDRSVLEAPVVLLATGKHDARGHPRPPPQAPMIAFKMHWRLGGAQAGALARQVELVWFEGGYAGLLALDGGRANLSLVISAEAYARLGRSWQTLVAWLGATAPSLGARLECAEPLWRRPPALARIPYGFVAARRDVMPGLYRLGDQLACIPSFAGEGVAIALRTARLAAATIVRGAGAEAYHAEACRQIAPAVGRAARLAALGTHPSAQRAVASCCRVLPELLPVAARITRLAPPSAAGPLRSADFRAVI